MQQFPSRPLIAAACLGAGLFVGVLSVAISIVSAVAGHDWAIADLDSLLVRLGVVFAGAGLVGAMPFVPFVLWLAGGRVRLGVAAVWIVGAALAGAMIGELTSPLVEANPYHVGIPGVLLGAGGGALLAAFHLAVNRGQTRQSSSR